MAFVPVEFWVVVCAVLGAILGSYANMAAYRLPRNISTVKVIRSFCPACQHQLAWHDNLPVLSFLLLRGRCHYCGKPIPLRYLLVELAVIALFAAAAWQFFVLNRSAGTALFAMQLFLIVDLMVLAVADLETWLIPPATTLPWILA
ncbi:MAG: prepilin peptidase, partial [Planctomycetota bacterium]